MSDDELTRVRARVYGRGAEATAHDIARLAALETRRTEEPEPQPAAGPETAASERVERAVGPAAPPRRRGRWVVAVALAIAAATGFGIGQAVDLTPAATTPPELDRAQTTEDRLDVIAGLGIGATSVRFIAAVADHTVSLARPQTTEGVCLIAVDGTPETDTDRRPRITCAPSLADGAGTVLAPGLTVAFGPLPSDATDDTVLSESVSAHRD